MAQETLKVLTNSKQSQLARDMLKRIDRLEDLAILSGNMMLFIVEGASRQLLVVDTSWQAVANKYPFQENIDYIGRASTMYSHPQIIRSW